ncbi:MAG: hypothetical protein RMK29_10165 [Myxococcales bacterium]|nr:hypothetical protein [Myxococcota bacterium]MDW8282067.1 hypothetical protein [Myxococcales bacterium]
MQRTCSLAIFVFVVVVSLVQGVEARAASAEPAAPAEEPSPAVQPVQPLPPPVPPPVSTPPPARLLRKPPPIGQLKNGFILAVQGTLVVTLIADPRIGNLFIPSVQAGLGVGYKLDRVMMAVGLEFGSTTQTSTSSDTGEVQQSTNSAFLIVPGVQVAVLRSADRKVELLGSARFGFGRTVSDMMAQDPNISVSPFSFMYEVGPGVRYWAHPHFAFAITAGFRGDYRFIREVNEMTGVVTETGVGSNGLFGAIGIIGTF